MSENYDYIIIGSGVLGLTIALTLKGDQPDAKIVIIDKEEDTAYHASGRNSGVLHAGFYYSADSLKAKLTAEGNRAMKQYCKNKGIAINECGKIVVAQNEEELEALYELERRGQVNGVNVSIIDEAAMKELEPNAKTFKKALYSPDTASIDPKEVCFKIKEDLKSLGVDFSFSTKYLSMTDWGILTTKGDIKGKRLINCAGLYADKIAQQLGFGFRYTMIPFKGIYLKYTKNTTDVKMNIYPVPNLKNPFLGVHFTKTVNNEIKIGPTAIPSFWRENYQGLSGFSFSELVTVGCYEAKLFFTNSFNFRDLAFEEMRKYRKEYFIKLASGMVKNIDPEGFTEYTKPGIRAQLLDKNSLTLLQDFVVEGDENSTHILNAVSPAFTCAFPFARLVVDEYILPK